MVGQKSCPWVIRASRGQRIQLGIIALGLAGSASVDDQRRLPVSCPKVVAIETAAEARTIQQQQQHQHDFNVCVRKTRERNLYSSVGHQLVVYVVAMTTAADVTSSSSAATHGVSIETRFMLFYKGKQLLLL